MVIAETPVGLVANINATEDPTMTDGRLALQTLLEKTHDANYLREMMGFAAQRLMELDMDDYESLSHRECKYYVVFVPKYRRKTLYGELRQILAANCVAMLRKGSKKGR